MVQNCNIEEVCKKTYKENFKKIRSKLKYDSIERTLRS